MAFVGTVALMVIGAVMVFAGIRNIRKDSL